MTLNINKQNIDKNDTYKKIVYTFGTARADEELCRISRNVYIFIVV